MPELTLERLLERLAKDKPVPAVLLLGTDAYLLSLCRAKVIEAYVPEDARVWGVSRFSAAHDSLERALGQAQTLPMLAARQLVFLEDLEVLERLGDAARDAAVDLLATYLNDPAPFTVLVLEASQLDQRMRLAKTLLPKVLVVNLALDDRPGIREAAAVPIAQQMARDLKVELDPGAAEALADLLNGELARIHVELEKLSTYVGDRRRITPQDVAKLVVSVKNYSVWGLAGILTGRQTDQALLFLDGLLRQGEEPAGIVGAIAWMVRTLLAVQELPRNADVWQVQQKVGRMYRETAELALRESRRIPREQLLDGLQALAEADSRLKLSGGRDAARPVMEFLVARLTGKTGAKAVSSPA
jgi:DNA polymerase-3 subunit delta